MCRRAVATSNAKTAFVPGMKCHDRCRIATARLEIPHILKTALLYEVASHVKQLPFRPLLLLLYYRVINRDFSPPCELPAPSFAQRNLSITQIHQSRSDSVNIASVVDGEMPHYLLLFFVKNKGCPLKRKKWSRISNM